MDSNNNNQEPTQEEPIINEAPKASTTPETQTEPAKPINEKPAKKSKTGVVVTFIIFLIVLVGAIAAVVILLNNGNNNGNGNNGGNSQTEEVETVIAEGIESKTMNDNLHIIFSQKISATGTPLVSDIVGYDYSKEIINGTFASKNQKLDAVLRYFEFATNEFKPISKADYKDSEDLSAYYGYYATRAEFFEDTTVISADTVAKLYYKVFGEEPEHQAATKICGGYYYNPTHKVYYNGPLNACGGRPSEEYFFKNVGYSKKGDIYYADYKISYSGVDDNTDGTSITKYYAGKDETSGLVKSFKSDGDVDEKSKLTDSDWEKVKTYRFVFVKNGDNFNYTGIIEK